MDLPATAWGPLTSLPLPVGAADLLRSLAPSRGTLRGRHRPRQSLAEVYAAIGQDAVRDWLGFDPPTLPGLRSAEVEEHVVVAGPRPVLPPRDDLHRGESAWVGVLYAPRGLDWRETLLAAPRELGLTVLGLTVGWGRAPSWIPVTRRDPACGDATTVDVHGTLVGVQHQEPGWTRLAWVRRRPGAVGDVVMHTAHEPLPAVELLVRDHEHVLG